LRAIRIEDVHVRRCQPQQLYELLDHLVLLLNILVQEVKLREALQGRPVRRCLFERRLDHVLESPSVDYLQIRWSGVHRDLILRLIFDHEVLLEKLSKGLGLN